MFGVCDDFQLGNRAEEKRTFHGPRFDLLRRIKGQCLGDYTSERVHAIEEEHCGSEQADFNSNRQIENHRQEECHQQGGLVGHGELSQANKFMPVAHVKGHEQEDGRKRTERNVHC